MRRALLLLLTIGLTAVAASSHAQPSAAPDAAPQARADSLRSDSAATQLDSAAVAALSDTTARVTDALADGATVSLLGRPLFDVWGGLGDTPPAARAELLSDRLADLARSRDLDPAALQIVDGNTLTTLQLGDVIVMTVTDADARALGRTRTQAAARYRQQILDGVTYFREQATVRGVLWGLAYSAGALLLLVLALRALGRLFGWLDRRTAAARAQYLRGVRIGTLEVVGKDQVGRFGRALVGLARLALSLILIYSFLAFAFGRFAWTQSWSDNLLDAALSPLRQLAAMLLSSVDNVIAIVVIVVVVRWVMQISDYLFQRVARGEAELKGFHADLADPTRKIVKFLLVVMGLMLIYPYTPIADNRGFQGLTVFFGLLLSLGSSTAISNMVAGVVLTYTRAFRIGDRVRVGEAFGDVVEKSFLVTRIRTTKNEDISVPNATVLSNHIVNYSRMAREGSGVILHTEVTIGYDVPWPTVHRLMTQAARDTAGIEPEPPPFVLQTALGDFSVAYQLNAYTREVTRMARLYSDMHQHIQDRFAEAEVEILSPTYGAYREGPSTVPDGAVLRDVAGRMAATAPAALTDGADATPDENLADLPDVELPRFLRGRPGVG